MTNEYICKQDAVGAVEFGITLASAINIETGEWTELFQRENDELREAVKRIKDIEPADVAPVVHSQWVLGGYDDMYYICKRCGHKQSEYYHKPTANFCPNCGAKMDGNGED